ncbi:hypothetical protein BMETH_1742_1 [methanotrophic bacterial endosymbiont of Bathymodiolus sp.]|nr:hypothetical protein BMETH_1742_1 [methanotrophic bacterial endosymbiont of Bathymodiolus sp.]
MTKELLSGCAIALTFIAFFPYIRSVLRSGWGRRVADRCFWYYYDLCRDISLS